MAKISLWKPNKGNDYKFIDRIAREQFYVGSLGIFVHKYVGIIDQGADDAAQPSAVDQDVDQLSEIFIQDLTLMENRNRDYADDVIELRGHFNEADKDFELLQFGLTLADGTKFITFHLNDMIDKLGRKLMSGDVLELPNLRDDAVLDKDAAVPNQWYVISDASWPTEGFSPTWFPHLWRVKAKPMTDSPEFYDITRNEDGDIDPLKSILSTYNQDIEFSEAVEEQAENIVPERNFETRHIYVVAGDEFTSQYPWIFAGDGIPPNESVRAETGTQFPSSPSVDDYFLRTDYEPSRLFKYTGSKWKFVEIDFRKTWNKAHRILETHINNEDTFTEKDKEVEVRQPISKAVKPRVDFPKRKDELDE